MLRVLALSLALAWSCYAFTQEIVISTLDNELYELDLADCSLTQIGNLNISTTDISFHPNGNLYAVSGQGVLYQINPNTGASFFLNSFASQDFFTSLTISAEGIFYAAGLNGELHSYDLANDNTTFLGNIGIGSEGDLTFYEGELYMAGEDDRIVRINLSNPANSTVVIDENISGRIFGIVSYAATCEDVSVYALTDQSANIYEVDLEANTMSFYCNIPLEASGGASTFEFLGSNPIDLNSVLAADFDCASSTGTITAEAEGGVGALTYSLDGVNYQASPVFTDLPVASYTVYVADEVGCIINEEVEISGIDLEITNVTITDASCGLDNGAANLTASGGTAPYQLLVNNVLTGSTTLTAADLAPGFYTFTVQDAEGCTTSTPAGVNGLGSPSWMDLVVQTASCGAAEGAITAEAIGGLAPLQYTLDGESLLPATAVPVAPGTYTLLVEDAQGCQVDTLLTVPQTDGITLDSIVTQAATCGLANATLEVFANSPNGALTFTVNGNTSQQSVLANVAAGTFDLLLTDPTNCTLSTTVNVADSPPLALAISDLVAADCNEANGVIKLDFTGGTPPFEVQVNGLTQGDVATIESLLSGTYALSVRDALACVDTLTATITSNVCPIYLPNVFSPNLDGVNDQFYPQAAPDSGIEVLRFHIYDRWGGQVFVSETVMALEDQQLRWDGRRNKELLPAGVYVYYLSVRHSAGQLETLSGEVTLLR